MKSDNVYKWIVVAAVSIVVLTGLAFMTQKPKTLSQVPLFAPTPTPTPISSGNIVVTSPTSGERVSQQFTLTGKARAFENTISMRLRDKLTGKIYLEGSLQTDAAEMGQFGQFKTGVPVNNANIRPGTELNLDVFQSAPKDGSEIDKVTIPLVFRPQPE